jgi:hypothetical protein
MRREKAHVRNEVRMKGLKHLAIFFVMVNKVSNPGRSASPVPYKPQYVAVVAQQAVGPHHQSFG